MTKAPPRPHSGITTLEELLAFADRDFVVAAYCTLLRRFPEPQGEAYYLGRLRDGAHKLDVLGQIKNSKEWSIQSATVEGLEDALKAHQRRRKTWAYQLQAWRQRRSARQQRAVFAAIDGIWADQARRAEDMAQSIERVSRRLDQVQQEQSQRQAGLERALRLLLDGQRAIGDAAARRADALANSLTALAGAAGAEPTARLLYQPGASVSDATGAPSAVGTDLAHAPLFSVVMPVYKTPLPLLEQTIASVRNQRFEDWELCICDDGSKDPALLETLEAHRATDSRVKLRINEHNQGISGATNDAMELVTGRFVVLLDHDDELTPDALEEFAWVLEDRPGVDAIYSDQDKIDENGNEIDRFYKPDWSPDCFRRVMYVGHLLAVRTELLRKVGGFDPHFDKVQDFEMMLRVSEHTTAIHHIPKILYRWRAIGGSIAATSDAKGKIEQLQSKAVAAHLRRLGIAADVRPHPYFPHRLRVTYEPPAHEPKVSIIIPTKDHPEHIGRCLDSIFNWTSYRNFEVVVVDNGTTHPEALEIMASYPVVLVPFNERFNYSRANNLGVAASSGEYVILLNNDTEVVSPDWIELLLGGFVQEDVGMTGALLAYPNKSVQHAGVVLGPRGTADHVMRHFPIDVDGYAGSLSCTHEVSGVTGACLMTSRALYDKVGGLVEHFGTHYQDVDLCLRIRELGKRILFVPDAMLIHYESATRGGDYDLLDRLLLQDRWQAEISAGDPYFNPAFSKVRLDFSLVAPGEQQP